MKNFAASEEEAARDGKPKRRNHDPRVSLQENGAGEGGEQGRLLQGVYQVH